MKSLFEQGSLHAFSQVRLDESMAPVLQHSQYGTRKTTVFISHKHDDLEDLKGLLGFLQLTYGVKVYIDSQDPTMPKVTSAETAINIKERMSFSQSASQTVSSQASASAQGLLMTPLLMVDKQKI